MKSAQSRPAVMIGAVGCFFFSGISPAEEKNSRTSDVPLTHTIAQESVGYSDLNAMAGRVGIDYPVLLQRALDRQRGAVFLLLWMAANAPLDGAGSEGYTCTMVRAAKIIEDQFLSEAAQALDVAALGAVRDAFLFEYGGTEEPVSALREVQKDFPKLWAALTRTKGEQDGGGQPVDRPESK